MGIRSEIADMTADLFASKGEDAFFHPAEGDPVPCRVFIDFDVDVKVEDMETQVWEKTTVIDANLAEIGRQPYRGEGFTVAGVSYRVTRILENKGFNVKAAVKAEVKP